MTAHTISIVLRHAVGQQDHDGVRRYVRMAIWLSLGYALLVLSRDFAPLSTSIVKGSLNKICTSKVGSVSLLKPDPITPTTKFCPSHIGLG